MLSCTSLDAPTVLITNNKLDNYSVKVFLITYFAAYLWIYQRLLKQYDKTLYIMPSCWHWINTKVPCSYQVNHITHLTSELLALLNFYLQSVDTNLFIFSPYVQIFIIDKINLKKWKIKWECSLESLKHNAILFLLHHIADIHYIRWQMLCIYHPEEIKFTHT